MKQELISVILLGLVQKMIKFKKNKVYLFVYGSLPPYLQDSKKVKALGFAKTIEKYSMYVIGEKYSFPALVKDEGLYNNLGTLYEIDPVLIRELDMFEGSPDFFKREIIHIQNIGTFFDFPKTNLDIKVQTYIFQEPLSKYPNAKKIR